MMSEDFERKFPAPVIPDQVIVDGYLKRSKVLLDELCLLMNEAVQENILLSFTIATTPDGKPVITKLEGFKRYQL